jgi:hypothetical protein
MATPNRQAEERAYLLVLHFLLVELREDEIFHVFLCE